MIVVRLTEESFDKVVDSLRASGSLVEPLAFDPDVPKMGHIDDLAFELRGNVVFAGKTAHAALGLAKYGLCVTSTLATDSVEVHL